MKITEKNLRNLTRNILAELFTKKSAFSTEEFLGGGRDGYGYDSASFDYDEIGGGEGFDDGGFGEADVTELEELTEDEKDME